MQYHGELDTRASIAYTYTQRLFYFILFYLWISMKKFAVLP